MNSCRWVGDDRRATDLIHFSSWSSFITVLRFLVAILYSSAKALDRGHDGSLALIGSASYKDDSFQFEIPQPLADQPSYTLVDASIVWSADDDRYQLALHGRNLTDEEYVVANYNFGTVDGSVIGFYGNPLTVTLTGTVRF
jgi:outer membrane receptor protein involved in Fe transport